MQSQSAPSAATTNSGLHDPGLRIALYRGTSLLSRLIRWQTRSPYSHAALVFKEGSVIEAWHRGGVAHNPSIGAAHTPGTEVDIFAVDGLRLGAARLACSFAIEQIGKDYDLAAVLRFLTRQQSGRSKSGKWFCSELVFAALQSCGVTLLERIQPCDVSPGHLALSPRLRFERTEITLSEAARAEYAHCFENLSADLL